MRLAWLAACHLVAFWHRPVWLMEGVVCAECSLRPLR
jgi:hypothetical protein